MNNTKKMSTNTMVLSAILTAIVIILQFLGSFIRLGPFSISLVLIPIVIGTALCGTASGAWLGFVFGVVVLLSGDAGAFLAINVPGTIITVLLKGTLCGYIAGVVYKMIEKHNKSIATVVSAIVCPIVNTGIFLIGCKLFFWDTVIAWGTQAGFANVGQYVILSLVGGNFLFELIFNVVISPIIVRVIGIRGKKV